MLSAVHAVVLCLSVRLSFHLQIMPHNRPGTLVFKWDVVAEFLLTSTSRSPSAIAEPLVYDSSRLGTGSNWGLSLDVECVTEKSSLW